VARAPDDHSAETAAVLRIAGDPRTDRALAGLARQHRALDHRGEVQLALSGILITCASIVTRLTASELVCVFVLIGSLFALGSATVVVTGVLRVRWLTQQGGEKLDEWIAAALEIRDAKTRAYHRASAILFVSLLFYQASIALALLERSP
jgi:hypothetical protein